jgi:acyl-CoA-binding protein
MAEIPLAGQAPYFGGKKTFKIRRKCPNRVGYSPFLENTMSDLKTKFELAAANSKNLSERPDNTTLLKIYALYKQASVGDNADKKPGFGDMVGRAKWDAWTSLKGTIKEDAMQQYIDLIESLS